MLASLLPSLVSGAAKLIGGMFAGDAAEEAADDQYEKQKEFAQNAIQWKAADARAAGIHPIYAMGAQTMGYSPVSVGDTSLGSTIADMGQDLSRAASAVMPSEERVYNKTLQALQLERAGLENDLLRSQIARENSAQVGPGGVVDPLALVSNLAAKGDMIPHRIVDPQFTRKLRMGIDIKSNRWFSDMQTQEDRYGEGSPLDWVFGAINRAADLLYTNYDYWKNDNYWKQRWRGEKPTLGR